ncbi:MAG: PTS cellobiose transporter subunit IIC [Erysipelotrichaceae bacterium]
MNKIFNFLEKYIMNPMAKMTTFRFVRAIMAAGMASIPFTIVGSMFLVLQVLPQAFPALEGIWNSSFVRISDLYMMANTFTMGVLAVYFCFVMGYELTKIRAEEENIKVDPLNGALLSFLAFLLTVPELVFENVYMSLVQSITESEHVINGIRMGSFAARLGTSGIFTGILMACLATWLYALCVKKNWTIRMPESVPSGVSKSFTALIPTAIIVVSVLAINAGLLMVGYDIYSIIAVPFGFVVNIVNSWYGLIIIYFLVGALWSVGIHGANIILAFVKPVVLANMASNYEAMQAGGTEFYAYAGEFSNCYVSIGGSGATLGLVFMMIFLAKSQQLKVLGKVSVAPAFFNINEPIIFGTPVVYNPFMIIPFILAPIVCALVAFFATNLGLVSPMIVQVPWPTPLGIGAFLGTGGDVRAILLAVVCTLLAAAIYLPFFKAYDNKLSKEESENAEELANNPS